ncbi:CBD9-like protein [Lindgomyces ingoldianus]|uniref:CBD9-like protein n=1 Tax=Lindgomyces ingoldianus TaxID=673940 RepID=A0ACB6QHM1_9PLEO|nr:CBD9-like protein [Lindgomyces ingoldianus]KAF2465636.1 CBD9-like protein [Lindgomyces ingoldianus]
MKFSAFLPALLAPAALAQSVVPSPYTDAKSGITFNYFMDAKTGYFFGLALPADGSSTDLIATIGGKGTGWSGVSLGGAMLSKLLIVAWPNGQNIVSSFRKTAQYGSPAVATGTFTQAVIPNGTYTNSTHWTYTFLCGKCIQTDKTTFAVADNNPTLGWAINAAAPSAKTSPSATINKHTNEGAYQMDLSKAKSSKFDTWKAYASAPKVFMA